MKDATTLARSHGVLGFERAPATLDALLSATALAARRARARRKQRLDERATRAALAGLDDHMLRDLGFERSEIASVAAEIAGRTDRSRVRTPQDRDVAL